MTQWVNTIAAKPGGPGLSAETHMVEGEHRLSQVIPLVMFVYHST